MTSIPPHILELCASQFTYEKFVSPLVDKLVSSNFQVTCAFNLEDITRLQPLPNYNKIKIDNISIHRSASVIKLIKNIFVLRKYFVKNKENFDIIHLHTPLVGICARIALFGLKFKVVYTVHGFYFHENMRLFKRLIHQTVEYILAKKTDLILFVSREDHEYAVKSNYKKSNRLVYIGNGCDIKKFRPVELSEKINLRKKYNIEPSSIVIGYSGRLVKEKGILNLLFSFIRILNCNTNIVLLLCGGSLKNEHGDNIQILIDNYCQAYPEKIIKTGFVDDIENFYNMMDIFVLPSKREGLPTSLIEANCCGIACVATNIRGCREIIIPEVSGVLVDPFSVDDLTAQLNRLVLNKSYRTCLAKNGLNNASRNYNIENVLSKIISELQSI